MAERPALYRLFRFGDAATLGVVAAVLVTGTAAADRIDAANGSDPSAAGTALAFQKGDRSGIIRVEGTVHSLPGRDPALGGPFAAVISGHRIQILDRSTLEPVGTATAYHAQSVAISRAWLAYLTLDNGRYLLKARRIEHASNPGAAKQIAAVSAPSAIGHPTVNKGRVVFTVSRQRGNAIKRVKLTSGERRTLLRSRTAQLLNPTVLGKHLLYVRVSRGSQGPLAISKRPLRQFLMMRSVEGHGSGRRIYKHDPDRGLWTTSMDAKRAFVTLLGKGGPRIVSVGR